MPVSDGDLRKIFKKYLPTIDWQSIETWSTGQGVPDTNACGNGREFWIENKATKSWTVKMRPEQIAWIERRIRHGGRVYIAVRRVVTAGPRRGAACDELYLFKGQAARMLFLGGLRMMQRHQWCLGVWSNGPANWDWVVIKKWLVP